MAGFARLNLNRQTKALLRKVEEQYLASVKNMPRELTFSEKEVMVATLRDGFHCMCDLIIGETRGRVLTDEEKKRIEAIANAKDGFTT